MRTIQASEAKTHLPQLLDDVERGATLIITRRGRPIARLVPEEADHRVKVEKAIQGIKALRRQTRGMTLKEILSARNEGRKY